jgi:hypothetical protein
MVRVRYVHLTKGQAYSQETKPSSHQRGCYVRTITARVQLKEKISLIVSLNGLGAKTNRQSQSNSDSDTVAVSWVGWWVCERVRGLLGSGRCELLLSEAGNRDRGHFKNPEKGERPPLEAATKQRHWRYACRQSVWTVKCSHAVCMTESNKYSP